MNRLPTRLAVILLLAILQGSSPVHAKQLAYVAQPQSGTISVLDTADNSLTTTVRLGSDVRPGALALSPDGRRAYFTNVIAGTFSVLDTATDRVIATIPVGSAPAAITSSDDGQFVYVANTSSCSVSVIDTAALRVVNTIPVPYYPSQIALSGNGAFLYVSTADAIVAVDAVKGTVLKSMRLGEYSRFAMSPNGTLLYTWFSGVIHVLNANTMATIANIPASGSVGAVVSTPDDSRAYAIGLPIAVIDTATRSVIATISVANAGSAIVSPDGARLYVASSNCDSPSTGCTGGAIAIIDTAANAVSDTVPLPAQPGGISLSPDGTLLYVTHPSARMLAVVDTRAKAVIATIPVPGQLPSFRQSLPVVFTPDGRRAYVTTDRSISAVDTATSTATTLFAGSQPERIAKSSDDRRVYVTDALANTLSVIDAATATVIATIPVGEAPGAVAVNGDDTLAYVANRDSGGSLSIVDLTHGLVRSSIAVGDDTYARIPLQLALSADGRTIYVTASRDQYDEDDTRGELVVVDTSTASITAEAVLDYESGANGIAFNSSGTLAYFGDVPEAHTASAISVVDTALNTVSGRIPIADSVRDIRLSADGSVAYVTTDTGNDSRPTVTVVDIATQATLATILLPNDPQDMTLSSNGALLYVTTAQSLTVVDTAARTIAASVPLQDSARGITLVSVEGGPAPVATATPAFPPSGARLPRAYVAQWDGSVAVVDGSAVAATISVSGTPSDIAILPDGAYVYVVTSRCVANAGQTTCTWTDGTISVIETATNAVIATILVGGFPQRIVVAPDGTRVYASIFDAGDVVVIDTATNLVTATIPVAEGVYALAASPDGGSVYVTAEDMVFTVDPVTNAVTSPVRVAGRPQGIAVTPDGKSLYVGGTRPDPKTNTFSVTVIDTATWSIDRSILFPENVNDIAIAPNGATAYVAASAACLQYVAAIDTSLAAVRANIPVDTGPYRVAVTPDSAFVYVTTGAGTISVIDAVLGVSVAGIPIAQGPVAVALMPDQSVPPLQSPTPRPTASAAPASPVAASGSGGGCATVPEDHCLGSVFVLIPAMLLALRRSAALRM